MFQIDAQSLPFVRTRQALLVLDLQNDFMSTGGVLPVETPPDFVDKILKLVPEFRALDNIIWIRSVFEASRPVNGSQGESESVITDKEIPLRFRSVDQCVRGRARPSQKLLEAYERVAEANGRPLRSGSDFLGDENDGDSVEETFLTLREGQEPGAVLPTSPGTNFSQAVSMRIDGQKDLIFEKSWYSAFKDGRLVQILRAKFVTGIYLCGALTNISVFATAMDAARHGYSITIVEDCLGYRSKPRHDEALRKLVEFTGCDIIKSEDLVEELRRKQKEQVAPRRHQRPSPAAHKSSGLEDLMSKLNLTPDRNSAPVNHPISTGQSVDVASAEAKGKLESPEAEDRESPDFAPPPKSEVKRERVRTKIKTRRRHSKSVPKDGEAPSGDKGESSLTAATLQATPQTVKELPTEEGQSTITASETSFTIPEKVAMEKSSGLTSEQFVELERKASTEAGLRPLCEGDTTVIPNLLDDELANGIFEKVRDEVRWQKMVSDFIRYWKTSLQLKTRFDLLTTIVSPRGRSTTTCCRARRSCRRRQHSNLQTSSR